MREMYLASGLPWRSDLRPPHPPHPPCNSVVWRANLGALPGQEEERGVVCVCETRRGRAGLLGLTVGVMDSTNAVCEGLAPGPGTGGLHRHPHTHRPTQCPYCAVKASRVPEFNTQFSVCHTVQFCILTHGTGNKLCIESVTLSL